MKGGDSTTRMMGPRQNNNSILQVLHNNQASRANSRGN